MGRRGVCYDNAGDESFFATIKRELVDSYSWNEPEILRIHLLNWIETFYNSRRTLRGGTPDSTSLVTDAGP